MKLRPPAVPLITCDPYFSVWSAADKLTDTKTTHWTGAPMEIRGKAVIDGKAFRFMGADKSIPEMDQLSFDMDAFSSTYTFAKNGVELTLRFTSPIKPDDLYLISRPVSYLSAEKKDTDGKAHTVSLEISVAEQICLDAAGQHPVVGETLKIEDLDTVKLGSSVQNVLARDGDNLRIDWGYFYLSAKNAAVSVRNFGGMTWACLKKNVADSALFTFAYDDRKSIEYFGEHLKAYWKRSGETIKKAIARAHREYDSVMKKCKKFSDRMIREATFAGGEKYADLLILSLRQSIAAHKLVLDTEGQLLFISKECFSNGCAATVDVSYPSIPLYLIYNPELVHAMMRPVYKYARSDVWPYDFAPHDAGRYPKVNGQVYHGTELKYQMPVEECGNMLVMELTSAIALNDVSFAKSNMDLLEQWVKYLVQYGEDPGNQLCTDDFAGHLAHNCNLTLKAIMGIAGYGLLNRMCGNESVCEEYLAIAKRFAQSFMERADNGDGAYRLAYNWQNSFSMKYNIIWDKLLGTELMPKEVIASEFASYKKHINNYGLPLDNRSDYTKSDWLIWCATMATTKKAFDEFITPMWNAYNETESRVPMTDWYFTTTALVRGFRNRTVVGGHFMRLLEYKKILKLN